MTIHSISGTPTRRRAAPAVPRAPGRPRFRRAPLGAVTPQGPAPQDEAPLFTEAELEQLVAPIALYPDELVSQVLMASTYTIEVVMAARFVEDNADLSGDALADALEGQDWDPSVKSLVAFPSVLRQMNERLDWTQKLGDAFLAQESDVMQAIQRLRVRADRAGQLVTTEQRTVIVERRASSASSPRTRGSSTCQIYDPVVVYGAWPWPACPPRYYYPRRYVYPRSYSYVSVSIGVSWGYAWGVCDWRRGGFGIRIDIGRSRQWNRRINYDRYRDYGDRWRHRPEHRRSVRYRDERTARRYGQDWHRSSRRDDPARGRIDPRGRGGRDDRGRDGRDRGDVGRPGTRERDDRRDGDRQDGGRRDGDRGDGRRPDAGRPEGGRPDAGAPRSGDRGRPTAPTPRTGGTDRPSTPTPRTDRPDRPARPTTPDPRRGADRPVAPVTPTPSRPGAGTPTRPGGVFGGAGGGRRDTGAEQSRGRSSLGKDKDDRKGSGSPRRPGGGNR
ncbi:MAG: DUF3300 domain-containing protein [Planctomycetota bacterium]